jgi:HEAT repeat protein
MLEKPFLGRLCGPVVILVILGCARDSQSPSHNLFSRRESHSPELAALAPEKRIDSLRELADEAEDKSPDEIQRTAWDLSQQLQSEQDPRIRSEILRTLANYPTDISDAMLRGGLKDAEARVRIVCCDAWARRGGDEAVIALAGIAQGDPDKDVRHAAIRALGECRGQQAIAALAPALEDTDPAMQYLAVQSLKEVTGRDLGNDVDAWRAYVQGQPVSDERSLARRWWDRVF